MKKAAEAARKGNIGGHVDPDQSGRESEVQNAFLWNAGWRGSLPPCRPRTGRKR